MDELLTDDELVALAVKAGVAWPTALLTVGTAADALLAASFRGVRSLSVRGLLDDDGAPRAGTSAADLVGSVLKTSTRVAAFIAAESAPLALAGGSLSAFRLENSTWIFDTASVNGVHALAVVDSEHVVQALTAFARRVFDEGINETGAGSHVAVLTTNAAAGRSLVVSQGRLAFGSFAEASTASSGFTESSSTSEWNPAEVEESVRALVR